MAGFTGRRLAIWDQANADRKYFATNATDLAAVDWLIAHYLAEWHEIPGAIRAIPIAQARERIEREGLRQQTTRPAAPAAPERPRVHAHQADLFLDERT